MPEVMPPIDRQRVAAAIGGIWWLPLLKGALLLVLGLYALFQPGMTLSALALVIAAFLIAAGVLAIIAGVQGQVPSRGWVIGRGILEVLVGVFVFANPVLAAGLTTTIVVSILAISSILFGIMEIAAAIQDRNSIEGEGWLIFGGAMMVVFGVVLLLAPVSFGQFVVRIMGAFAILISISLILFAFRLRKVGQRLHE